MAQTSKRPLSPHLLDGWRLHWRWGPHMLVSILHRVTGNGLAVVGAMALVWWLYAAAMGGASYETFMSVATSLFGRIILIGLTWAFLQHMFSGLRHFVMDMGAGYELKTNKAWSIAVTVLAILATVAIWACLLAGKAAA